MTEKISLIIPCKNEKESLGAVLDEIKNNQFVDLLAYVCCESDNTKI